MLRLRKFKKCKIEDETDHVNKKNKNSNKRKKKRKPYLENRVISILEKKRFSQVWERCFPSHTNSRQPAGHENILLTPRESREIPISKTKKVKINPLPSQNTLPFRIHR